MGAAVLDLARGQEISSRWCRVEIRGGLGELGRRIEQTRHALVPCSARTTRHMVDHKPVLVAADRYRPDAYHRQVASGAVFHDPANRLARSLAPALIESHQRFVDVGANLGAFSLPLALAGVKVLAFEMVPRAVDLHDLARRRNGLSENALAIVRTAIGTTGSVSYAWASAWASIVDDSSNGDRAPHIRGTSPSMTLDEALGVENRPSVGLVKIDVEGAERDVLAGGGELFADVRPDVIIEANAATCGARGYSQRLLLERLADWGYALYRIESDGLWRWSPADYQELVFCDYFASCRSEAALSTCTGWTIADATPERQLANMRNQFGMPDLHILYFRSTADVMPRSLRESPEARDLLSRADALDMPDVVARIAVGAA